MAKVSNRVLKVQKGTDRTMYITWKWTKSYTDHYEVVWQYNTGNGVWFDGTKEDVTSKQSIYSAPTNAKKVRVRVKPHSKTHTVNKKEVLYWKADWCDWKEFTFTISAPKVAGKPYNVNVEEENNNDGNLIATWDFKQDKVDHYRVVWDYATGNGVWLRGNESDVTLKQATYSLPSNATKVRFKVKPYSKKHTVYGKEVEYWKSDWSSYVEHSAKDFMEPEAAPTPNVQMLKYKLTAEIDIYDEIANFVEFQVVRNNTKVVKNATVAIVTNHAQMAWNNMEPGSEYKVRCRAVKVVAKVGQIFKTGNASQKTYGDWSEYSDNVKTVPAAIKGGIKKLIARSDTLISLWWDKVSTATSYEVQWTDNKLKFDSSSDVQSLSVTDFGADITGLEMGKEWFFRVRAVNDQGESSWTPIKSLIVGKKPAAPTTWMETATVELGKDPVIYWVHNSQDNSREKEAQIDLRVNGKQHLFSVVNNKAEDDPDTTSMHVILAGLYGIRGDSEIMWRVRTKGILPEWGDWSITRHISITAPASLEFANEFPERITKYPFSFGLHAGPTTQHPTSYQYSIIAMEQYETKDSFGKIIRVNANEEIYKRYINTSNSDVDVVLRPTDVLLENNVEYRLVCNVATNRGMRAEVIAEFTTAFDDDEFVPCGDVYYDKDTYTAMIRPYCPDVDGNPIPDIILSVYRRNFDGSFTLIADEIENSISMYVTDPHPSLDAARYRIVATSKVTGFMEYYDTPDEPTNEPGIIIQWDEEWIMRDETAEQQEQHNWSGSLIHLKYNVDTNEDTNMDVNLTSYIGREQDVSYYGTKIGHSGTWSAAFDKNDSETLFQLRRLQRYRGDVYVREQSGVGYWANVKVSISQSHDSVTIPVSFTITRVEGGV